MKSDCFNVNKNINRGQIKVSADCYDCTTKRLKVNIAYISSVLRTFSVHILKLLLFVLFTGFSKNEDGISHYEMDPYYILSVITFHSFNM